MPSPACPLCLLPTDVTLGAGQGQFFLEVEEQVARPPRFHPNPELFLDCNERAPDPSPPSQLPLLLWSSVVTKDSTLPLNGSDSSSSFPRARDSQRAEVAFSLGLGTP